MLGPPKPRRLDQPIAVSLEDLVPQAHFYRHLEGNLDLSFVREWVRERYGERGRPSIAGQNLKRLLSHGGWGRRPVPAGAISLVLPALPRLLAPVP